MFRNKTICPCTVDLFSFSFQQLKFNINMSPFRCTSTRLISDFCQKIVSKVFYNYGINVFRYPYVFVLCSIIITGLSLLGFQHYEYENRTVYLWVPQSSQIFKNYKTNVKYFGENDKTMSILIHNINNNNLLTPANMNIMYQVYKQATNNVSYIDSNNREWRYDDLCVRPYHGYAYCSSYESNIFALFEHNSDNWSTQESIQTIINSNEAILQVK